MKRFNEGKFMNNLTTISSDTPLAMLTVGQLLSLLKNGVEIPKKKSYVYGLKGIAKLFNVSNNTAAKYKERFLGPAIAQQGNTIIVDADMAMQLFRDYKRRD